jgi:hypothetical protein
LEKYLKVREKWQKKVIAKLTFLNNGKSDDKIKQENIAKRKNYKEHP